jgi:hypothetical protein
LSNALVVQRHPRIVVDKVVHLRGARLVFTYSRYEVAPPGQQAAAPRTPVLRVRATDVTNDWVKRRLAELGPREELAWHSCVECDGIGFHIPMIDFLGRPKKTVLHKLNELLAEKLGLRGHFIFFETGRSFHGYFPDLIPDHVWHRYLGDLLLVNCNNHQDVIDSRWVGHALVRGFTALRWSHNTTRYAAMPELWLAPERSETPADLRTNSHHSRVLVNGRQ